MYKILVTGGDGRFAGELKKIKSKYKFIFRNKKQFNILSLKSIEKNSPEWYRANDLMSIISGSLIEESSDRN